MAGLADRAHPARNGPGLPGLHGSRISFPPPLSPPVVHRLGDVWGLDVGAFREIRDRPCDAADAIEASRRESETLRSREKNPLRFPLELRVPVENRRSHPCLALGTAVLGEAFLLPHPRRRDTLANRKRGLAARGSRERRQLDRRHLDHEIEPVDQWSRQLPETALDLERRALAAPAGTAVKPALAPSRCLLATCDSWPPNPSRLATPSISTIQVRLQARRVDVGRLQRDVTSRLGVNMNSVQDWEKGRALPSKAVRERLKDSIASPRPPRRPRAKLLSRRKPCRRTRGVSATGTGTAVATERRRSDRGPRLLASRLLAAEVLG